LHLTLQLGIPNLLDTKSPMETTSSFGYWIRRQRKALDLTQQALADQVGCSLAAIKKIEQDQRRPSRQIAERLADILGVPISQHEIFLEVARGIRPVDQLLLAREPSMLASTPLQKQEPFRHNLPMQLTSFIGRERELEEVKRLLSNTRLLTLTGIGGTGKTRLALHLAADMLALKQFANGVWLVDFAPLADSTFITQAVASALGVREQPRRTLLDALTDYVRAKNLLLILDNCEHLIQSCAQLTDSLLRTAPRLKVLVTSREALGIAGETTYRVPSLPLPEPQQLHDLEALAQNDCAHLFVDRAMAAYPSFHLKEKNAYAVADICRRLDGIPLAIELAAARTKVFPPEEIAARLDDRFKLLTGGSRTALERHQTLFALIEWSHNLLSEPERVLLRRLSVFAGGWSFDAAQEVCGEGLDDEVLDLLTHLVDKSLVVVEQETEAARYRLPETIRQYARDKLYEAGEAEKIRDRHLELFIQFAEIAEPKLRSAEQIEWLERVETEHDNLRTALAWSLESGNSESALRLAGALGYFWELRGVGEGYNWLNEALALAEREPSGTVAAARRAKALYGAGRLRFMDQLDVHSSLTLVEESLRLSRQIGDKWWMAVALEHIGFSTTENPQTAIARLEEGVSLARQVENRWPLALCLVRLAGTLATTDAAASLPIHEEAVAVARSVGDRSILSQELIDLSFLYQFEGNLTVAESAAEEALAAARAIRDFIHEMLSLVTVIVTSCFQGDLVKAKRYCFEMLDIVQETGSTQWLTLVLVDFGFVAIFNEQSGRGVRVLAAGLAILRQRGINLVQGGSGPFLIVFKQVLDKAQAQLGPEAFQAAWAEGEQMTLEQALALATENEGEDLP
jgi:predicted ATPase/DNA-binding XRE family transcriptional regulator